MITILGSALSMAMTIYISKHPEEMFQKTFNIFLPTQICMAIDMILFSIALQKKIADNEKSLISTAFQRQRAVMAEGSESLPICMMMWEEVSAASV